MPKGMKPSPNFKGNKNSGDKPDSFKRRKWLEEETTLRKLEIELSGVQDAMAQKNLGAEEYKTLVEVADKLIKNIQLLGGKPTENIVNKIEISDLDVDKIFEEYEFDKRSKDSNLKKDI